MSATAYPLQWPDGWPRTPYRSSSHPFGGKVHGLTFDRARRQLSDELARLGARDIVLSTNVELRLDGAPYANAAGKRMNDPGVAVYFFLKKKQMVMAQDHYTDIAANMRSLALAIEAMRQLERHGGGTMMERAFTGFVALAPTSHWRTVLGLGQGSDLSPAAIDAAYRKLARTAHPDMPSGSHAKMAEL